MNIIFNPPVGQSVHVGVSSLIAKIRPTVLLFTARLDERDYQKLVENDGKVQLWSDIPHDGAVGGGWHQLDFQESAMDSTALDTDSTIISLNGPTIRPAGKGKVLCLPVRLPAGISSLLRFQFTYRISYPKGKITWMGGYRQNGSVVLDDLGVLATHGLVLEDGWVWSESRHAAMFEIADDNGVEIIRIESPTDFKMLALGEQRTLPDLKDASLLCLVPRHQPYLTLRPTYILSVSPGLSITVQPNGAVMLFGAGTAIFEAHDRHSNPYVFFNRLLKHAQLDAWNIIPSDTSSSSVLLTGAGSSQPMFGVIIPLWPSEHLLRPLLVPYHSLVGTENYDSGKWLALFVPYNLKIHLLGPLIVKSDSVTLSFDATNSEFLLSTVYRLRGAGGDSENQTTLGVTILTPHRVVPAPSPLPTPPPSPSVSATEHLEQSWPSIDTAIASVERAPSDVGAVNDAQPQEIEQPATSTTAAAASRALIRRAPSPSQTRTLIAWIVRSFLVPMTMFWQILLRLLCLRFPPFSSWHERTSTIQPDVRLSYSEPDEDIEHSEGPDDIDQEVAAPSELSDASASADSLPEAVLRDGYSDTVVPSDTLSVPNLTSSSSDPDMIFVELHSGADGTTPVKRTTTSTIALFPLNNIHGASGGDVPSSIGPALKAEDAEKAARLLDGSAASSPKCSISNCEIFVHDRLDLQGGSSEHGECALLEFQLDWEVGQKGRTVGIAVPHGNTSHL